MAQIILVVVKPDVTEQQNKQLWKSYTDGILSLTSKNKDIQLLGENVLLISLENNLDAVSKAILLIGKDLQYKYQVLNEALDFCEVANRV